MALSVPADLVDRAAEVSVRDFLAEEPWGHRCSPDYRAPLELDLDKSWGYLQRVFGPEESASPAYELVRGQVTNTCCGWIPFERFVPPAVVKGIAADLADVDECFVMDGLARGRSQPDERFADDVRYTLEYLGRAAEFTRALSDSGSGLVYWIG